MNKTLEQTSSAPQTMAAKPVAKYLIPALLACYFVWGSTYLAIRFALISFPPFLQMGARFVFAGLLLTAFMRFRGAKWPTQLEWRNAFVVGALMLGGGMGLTGVASQTIGSGLIATFIAVVPMLVCGWGLLWGKRPSPLEIAGMVVGMVGVFLLVHDASFSASGLGLMAISGATLLWSLGSVLQTTKLPLATGPMGFASEMLCGGAALLLIAMVLGEAPQWPPAPIAVAAWFYLVVFGSLIGFSSYLYLLANASPALATSYAFVNPVIALFLGVLFGAEIVSNGEWFASAVVLFGVVLIFLSKREKA